MVLKVGSKDPHGCNRGFQGALKIEEQFHFIIINLILVIVKLLLNKPDDDGTLNCAFVCKQMC